MLKLGLKSAPPLLLPLISSFVVDLCHLNPTRLHRRLSRMGSGSRCYRPVGAGTEKTVYSSPSRTIAGVHRVEDVPPVGGTRTDCCLVKGGATVAANQPCPWGGSPCCSRKLAMARSAPCIGRTTQPRLSGRGEAPAAHLAFPRAARIPIVARRGRTLAQVRHPNVVTVYGAATMRVESVSGWSSFAA